MEYKLKFQLPYIDCTNYKEKDLLSFINLVNGSRVGNLLCKYRYGTITYDQEDKQKFYPIVNELDNFSRSKTNCIIFDIREGNCNKYNKLFLYQSILKDSGFYGFVAYNTETNKMLHIYNIDLNYTQLFDSIQRIFAK